MNLVYGCVTLRPIEMRDAKLLKNLMDSPEIEHMTVGWNFSVSEHAQEEWIRNYRDSMDCIRWMVELDKETTLGMVVLNALDWKNRTALLGYKKNLHEKNSRKNAMKDAVYAVLKYAFDELNLHRIGLSIIDYNIPSMLLAKSVGFKEEGVWRKKIFKSGEWHDEVIFGLLCEEFEDHKDGTAPWQEEYRCKS